MKWFIVVTICFTFLSTSLLGVFCYFKFKPAVIYKYDVVDVDATDDITPLIWGLEGK